MNNVHPVELITQQLIEQPLESLGLQLHKLYESQLLILNLLQSYEQKLAHYSELSQDRQHNSHLLIRTYNDRIYHMKLKLLKINKTLDLCNSRIDKVMDDFLD